MQRLRAVKSTFEYPWTFQRVYIICHCVRDYEHNYSIPFTCEKAIIRFQAFSTWFDHLHVLSYPADTIMRRNNTRNTQQLNYIRSTFSAEKKRIRDILRCTCIFVASPIRVIQNCDNMHLLDTRTVIELVQLILYLSNCTG